MIKVFIFQQLKSEVDTSNFDHFDEEEPWYVEDSKTKKNRKVMGQHEFFI